MMQITEFDRSNARDFQNALNAKLKEVGDEFGITIEAKRVAVQNRRSVSIEAIATVGEEVSLEDTKQGRMFNAHAPGFGLTGKLGKSFTFRGTVYTITGWSPSSHKYKVECERMYDGAIVRFEPGHVRSMV